MSILFLLIPLSIVIATCFLGAFIWAVRSGQYEDTYTPSLRLLGQDHEPLPIQESARHALTKKKDVPKTILPAIGVESPNALSDGRTPKKNPLPVQAFQP